jgi:hypothetical protein
MTDAATREAIGEKCEIHHSIEQRNLEQLLGVLLQTLRVKDSVTGPDSLLPYRIYPDWLSQEFVRSRSEGGVTPSGFYLDPREKTPSQDLPAIILTLFDLVTIFESILEYIEDHQRENKYGGSDLLDEKQHQLLTLIKGQALRNRLNPDFLIDDTATMLSIVATLKAGGQQTDQVTETDLALPIQYNQLLDGELKLGVSWEWVLPLAEDANNTEVGANIVRYRYENAVRAVDVKQIRFFFNSWLRKFYEQYEDQFESRNLALPENRLFDATNKSVAYFDLPNWNELDEDVISFILKDLKPLIEQFLNTAIAGGVPGYSKKDTEEEENKQELTEDATVDELDSLLEKFQQAGKSYANESARLSTILLPQLFQAHGFRENLINLEGIDPLSYALVRAEFQVELENVLRSLTPKEFGLLQQRGATLEFRMIVLRKLYGKLGTNPRFIGALNRCKDVYVKELQQRVQDKKISESELKELERKLNAGDIEFDSNLARVDSKSFADWSKEFQTAANRTEKPELAPLQDLASLNSLTQADLKLLLLRLTGDSTLDFDALSRNLDSIIAERWSPEQIRSLDVSNVELLERVLGLRLTDSIRENDGTKRQLLNVLAEFLYTRRQRLADHYRFDAIGREDGRLVANGERGTAPTDQQLALLEGTRKQAEQLKDNGGGETIIAARSGNSARIGEYEKNHPHGAAIAAVHKTLQAERRNPHEAQDEQTRQTYTTTRTIAGKRALIASLGINTGTIDDVQTDEARQLALLNQWFEEGMRLRTANFLGDLDEFSYFEDLDDGVVQDQDGSVGIGAGEAGYRSAGYQRYGQGDRSHSLLKGALNVRSKLQQTKKRVEQAKKVLKAAGRGLESLEGAIAAPLLGPLAQNKTTRRAGLAIVGGFFLDTMSMLSQGGIATKAFGLLGSLFGGGAGFLATGGTIGIPIGALSGGWLGTKAGYALDTRLGLLNTSARIEAPTGLFPGGAAKGAGGLGGGQGAGLGLSGSGTPGGFGLSTGQVVAATGTGGYVLMTLTSGGGVISNLQPPPLGTIGADGQESQYVIIQKTAQQGDRFESPTTITYQIYVESKDDYQIEITNFTDEFTIKPNSSARGSEPPPATPVCDISYDGFRNRVGSAPSTASPAPAGSPTTAGNSSVIGKNSTLDPGETEDGRIFIGECTVNFDETYHDTGIQNTFNLTFNVIDGSTRIENQTAQTVELVCFGECPQFETGGWPTTGLMRQGPYGAFSHGNTDGIDFAKLRSAPPNVGIYATFPGTAWFFVGDSSNPAIKGVDKNYGNHVVLVTDNGFILLFAHLREFSAEFQPGQSYQIQPCTQLGWMGTTGYSTGVHLHYEYRVSTGRSWYSVAAGGRRILETLIPQPYQLDRIVNTNCGP